MQPTLVQAFPDWYELYRRHQIALAESLCSCCSRIHRVGDPGPRPVRAVVSWTTRVDNTENLCAECLRCWNEGATEDAELRPVWMELL